MKHIPLWNYKTSNFKCEKILQQSLREGRNSIRICEPQVRLREEKEDTVNLLQAGGNVRILKKT